ncbi:hypothetical protein [Corynebacterium sp. HMSC076D02]|uniref:hypothetical protein n=1 Tax=Corynebacterium sp. HMSC076D02 TaxID=1739439 RepID=UPI0009F6E1D7|nr:hypothetical protein [Corynebacterium sp. HMSC076D02]
MSEPRKRRRAVRRSAVDYDRTADQPDFVSAFDNSGRESGGDAHRVVQLDEDAPAEQKHDETFYREQMPPHYGQ